MHKFWPAAAVAVMLCGGARAAEGPSRATSDAAVGVGIICNTVEQAEQFVSLRGNGARPDQAMRAVNANARDERACGVAAIAYFRGQTVDTMTLKDNLVQIVRINVVAGFNGSAWQRVVDKVQYAVVEGGGEAI